MEEFIKERIKKEIKVFFSYNQQKRLISFIQNLKSIVFLTVVQITVNIMIMWIKKNQEFVNQSKV